MNRVPGRETYPIILLLTACLIGSLGLYPHLRFSMEHRSLEYFFYSYDEGFYNTRGLAEGGPGRTLATLAVTSLLALCGSNLELALVVVDFLLPAAAVLVAGFLAAAVTRSLPGRLALVLGLLFAAEFATHLFNSWLPRWSTLMQGPWQELAVQAAPILFLFRTPEPQISWLVAFGFLGLVFTLCRRPAASGSRKTVLAFLAAGALLGLGYVPVLVACVLYVSILSVLLAVDRQWRLIAVLLGGALLAIVTSLLASLLSPAPAGAPAGASDLFATSLPAFSPLTLLSLGLLPLWILRLARTRERPRLALLGMAASLTPIVLMNQQLVTGTAVGFKIWEEYASHLFVVLGVGCYIATLQTASTRLPKWLRRLGPQVAAALVGAAILAFAAGRQNDSFRWFYALNEEEEAAANLLDEHYPQVGPRGRVLFDAITTPQRLGIRSANEYRPVVSFDDVFVDQVPTLDTDPDRTGAGSRHADAVFEFLWRRGVAPAELRKQLEEEAQQHALLLLLFFSHMDAWGPATTWRQRRDQHIAAAIPSIVAAYQEHLRRAPERESAGVHWVSTRTPPQMRELAGFDHELLATRATSDGRTLHLYRQRTRPPAALADRG